MLEARMVEIKTQRSSAWVREGSIVLEVEGDVVMWA
jgi:hypothetical protein